jgi:hypothetical protein
MIVGATKKAIAAKRVMKKTGTGKVGVGATVASVATVNAVSSSSYAGTSIDDGTIDTDFLLSLLPRPIAAKQEFKQRQIWSEGG